MKVLKAYPIDGKFHYDVRSIHSWGLPRREVPENRLKGNAAGFSAFGSLEIFGNRGKSNRKEDRQEIKRLKSTLAILRKNIEDLKREKSLASKEATSLKRELDKKKEALRSLRPCKLFDGRRKACEVAQSIKDHVNVLISIKEDEIKAMGRDLDLLQERFVNQKEDLRECKDRLQWIEKSGRDYSVYIEKQEDRLRELKEAQSTISSLREDIEVEKDDKDRLSTELRKSKKRCHYLSRVVENMKEQLDDAFFDIENKSTLAREEVDDMIRRLFAGGLSIGDVQKVLDEVDRLHPGKVPIKGASKGYLCQVRRDMRGVNRLVASIMIGNAESIQQLDFDDSNFDEVTITTTFLGLKMGGAK